MSLPTSVNVIAGRLGEAEARAALAEAALIEIREEAVKAAPDVKRIGVIADTTLGGMQR